MENPLQILVRKGQEEELKGFPLNFFKFVYLNI